MINTNVPKCPWCGAPMADEVLAQRLLEIEETAEEIPFCKDLPDCQKLADESKPVPADKCLQCLINWLGQPAEEEIWKD